MARIFTTICNKSDHLIAMTQMRSFLVRIKSFVKEGGFDRNVNTKLDALRKQYKADSLPIETFDAHLLKLKNNPDVVVSYNFIGPNNSLFIVEFEAENKSRIQRDVNKHLKKLPDFRLTSNLTETHFEEKGVIVIKAKTKESVPLKLEQLEEVGIELECEDVQIITGDHPNDSSFELICAKAHVNKIETELDKRGYQVISAEVQARPFERISMTENDSQKVDLFYKELRENESVKSIFDNIEYS
uniref:TACO1/YebC-like second and third domain-containing protein n=1 Tax=Ditylenchus dipsaci TaxID=166011 RepID=A0A915CYB3_9BILA